MPLRYPEIADDAFTALQNRTPLAPRAIALAFAISRPEFIMDLISAGKGHINAAELLRQFVPTDEDIHTTTIKWRHGEKSTIIEKNESALRSLPKFVRTQVEQEIIKRISANENRNESNPA